MIKLVRSTARSSHVWRYPARSPDHLPVSYYPAYAALSAFPSAVRPPTRALAWQLQPLSRPTASSASRPHCPRLPSTTRSQVPGRFSDSRRDAAAIDCPLFPRSRVDVSGDNVSTCCLMKMAAFSSLDRICKKSDHRFLQPSVTVEINFFGFNLAYG